MFFFYLILFFTFFRYSFQNIFFDDVENFIDRFQSFAKNDFL